MFLAVSVLAGLLTAGLVVPFAAMAGASSSSLASSLEALPAELETPAQAQRSVVRMGNGKTLATFYDENRIYVPLKRIAPIMQKAQIAIEDHRFYEHGAIDVKGTLRALVRNSAGGQTQGGSTLTQQYVKLVRVETAALKDDEAGVQAATETSYQRKIQEARYALALEKKLSKDQILERYLNIAYYGDGAYGVESAAHHYFGTTAAKLTLAQAAMIAGIVQNPVMLDPVNHPKAAIERRNVVLARMAELKIVDKADAEKAMKEKFDRSKVKRTIKGCQGTEFPHLCQYVRNSLIRLPNGLGKTAKARQERLDRGGLMIQTQIDPRTQKAAEKAIAGIVEPKDPVLATMNIVQPGTGLIVAMAQSRPKMGKKAGETYYNYSVDAAMDGAEGYQAGSTFKAFTVAAALKAGIPPTKKYNAKPRMDFTGQTFKGCDGESFVQYGRFNVGNSTGRNGVMDMYNAAAYSVNTYFVQLEQDAGVCATTRMADAAGVKSSAFKKSLTKLYANIPSFTLGAAEVTPLSLANAYATFAARGKRCTPTIIKSVKDGKGKSIKLPESGCEQTIPKDVADGVNKVLRRVMSGTGARATIPGGYPQAGKTGTTDSNKSVWFCGYTPEMAGCAMIAIDKTNKWWKKNSWRRKSLKYFNLPYGGYLEGSGGGDAGMKIYRPSMAAALKGKPRTAFKEPPANITTGKRVSVPWCAGGSSVSACEQRLRAAGFSPIPSYTYSGYPKGTVAWIYPSGSAPQWSNVTIGVSKGAKPKPKPKKTKKPDKPSSTKSSKKP